MFHIYLTNIASARTMTMHFKCSAHLAINQTDKTPLISIFDITRSYSYVYGNGFCFVYVTHFVTLFRWYWNFKILLSIEWILSWYLVSFVWLFFSVFSDFFLWIESMASIECAQFIRYTLVYWWTLLSKCSVVVTTSVSKSQLTE